MISHELVEDQLRKYIQLLWFNDYTIEYPPYGQVAGEALECNSKLVELANKIVNRFPKETDRICSYDVFSRDILFGRCLALAWVLDVNLPDFKRACLKEGLVLPLPEIKKVNAVWLREIGNRRRFKG